MSKTRNYFKDFIKNITIKGTVMDGTFTSTFNSRGMINTGIWKENKMKWTHNLHSYFALPMYAICILFCGVMCKTL